MIQALRDKVKTTATRMEYFKGMFAIHNLFIVAAIFYSLDILMSTHTSMSTSKLLCLVLGVACLFSLLIMQVFFFFVIPKDLLIHKHALPYVGGDYLSMPC